MRIKSLLWRGADPTPLAGSVKKMLHDQGFPGHVARHLVHHRGKLGGVSRCLVRRVARHLIHHRGKLGGVSGCLARRVPSSHHMIAERQLDFARESSHNCSMSTEIITTPAGMGELQEAVDRLMSGVRDRAAMRKAREDMNRMREETRRRIGTVDLAVELVRDARQ